MEDRNFRYSYYDKVGFRGVEEKKSLQILLKEDPLDIGKLSMFCLRFSLPASFRTFVWKLILGIVSVHPSTHDFVMKQRRKQYNHLRSSLKMMNLTDDTTPLSRQFLLMFLLEERRLPMEEDQLINKCLEEECFVCIAEAVLDIADDEVESYWIAISVRRNYTNRDTTHLSHRFLAQIEQDDPELMEHLEKTCVLAKMDCVYRAWFGALFAKVIPPGPLSRVWDHLFGGAYYITVNVAIAFVVTYRRQLLGMAKYDAIIKFLLKVPPDSADVLVSEAIDKWVSTGSQTKPDTF